MNAVVFFVTKTFRLTGSTINAIEYFLAAAEHNPEMKLFMINGNMHFKRTILKLMNERYILDGVNLSNIKFLSIGKFIRNKIQTALVVDYMTIGRTKGLMNCDNIIVISEKHTDNPRFFYDKNRYNVVYYGEMPFHYKDHDYRMKCAFNRYKPLRYAKEGTYINSPMNTDLEGINTLGYVKPVFFKSKTDPKENLFEQFTHYVYLHANKWFDPHPRLFLECAFYDKHITYINDFDVKDGSYYRHKDLQENGLKDRILTKDDEIICQLI
jgi:hypothetical protein